MNTLPDYLQPGLDIVLVGLNPSLASAQAGRYFASPRNRFWRALECAGVFAAPPDATRDRLLFAQGIGLTDVVKRPTRGASDLRAADYRRWAPVLRAKLRRYRPLIVCFHGAVAYRAYLRYAENAPPSSLTLGLQPRLIAQSRVYLIPNPSPANAAYSLADLARWYRRLWALRAALRRADTCPPRSVC